MRKVLLPVDASEHSDQATHFTVELVKDHAPSRFTWQMWEPEPIEWQTHGMEDKAIDAHLTSVTGVFAR